MDNEAPFTIAAAGVPWHLGPLAAASGELRARIIDAHLGFDADVTVPIRHGTIDFDDAEVEHVGPDSRMGISPTGLYVDAPNGRTHVWQFASPPVAGVEYEKRSALLGPWVSDRGKLQLQAFAESLLRDAMNTRSTGLTEEARLLLGRTSLDGEVHLGDARFAAAGVEAELTGSAQGCNAVRVHSDAVARGLTLTIAALSVKNVALDAGGTPLHCDEVTGSLTVRLVVDGGKVRVESDLAGIKVSGLRIVIPAAPV